MTNIIFKAIDIHNFFSFKDQQFNFDSNDSINLIQGLNFDTTNLNEGADKSNIASNGSGKSALLLSLLWNLYGKFPSKIHNKNIINKFCRDIRDDLAMFVDLEVDIYTAPESCKSYRIKRGMNKNNVFILQLLEWNEEGQFWKDISKSTNAETQYFIEQEILQMNFDMFLRMVMISIDSAYNFFKLNAAQKREFIETLFDTKTYSEMDKLLGNDIKKTENVVTTNSVKLNTLEKNKEQVEASIETYKQGINDKLQATVSQINEMETELANMEESLTTANEKKQLLQDKKDKAEKVKDEIQARLNNYNNTISSLKQTITYNEKMIVSNQKSIDKFKDILNIVCDDCNKKVKKFGNVDEHLANIENLQKENNEKAELIKTNQEQRTVDEETFIKFKDAHAKLLSAFNDANNELIKLKYRQDSNSAKLLDLQKERDDLTASMNNPEKIPGALMANQLDLDISETAKQIDTLGLKLEYLKLAESIVNPKAIRDNIVCKVIESLNQAINKYLQELRINIKCTLSDNLDDYSIINENGDDLDYQNLSKGEQMKLLLSTQLAFRNFLMLRFNIKCNCMILDEVIDSNFDTVSIKNIFNTLVELSMNEGSHIYIISHRNEVSNMMDGFEFAKKITVEKRNNISRVIG